MRACCTSTSSASLSQIVLPGVVRKRHPAVEHAAGAGAGQRRRTEELVLAGFGVWLAFDRATELCHPASRVAAHLPHRFGFEHAVEVVERDVLLVGGGLQLRFEQQREAVVVGHRRLRKALLVGEHLLDDAEVVRHRDDDFARVDLVELDRLFRVVLSCAIFSSARWLAPIELVRLHQPEHRRRDVVAHRRAEALGVRAADLRQRRRRGRGRTARSARRARRAPRRACGARPRGARERTTSGRLRPCPRAGSERRSGSCRRTGRAGSARPTPGRRRSPDTGRPR